MTTTAPPDNRQSSIDNPQSAIRNPQSVCRPYPGTEPGSECGKAVAQEFLGRSRTRARGLGEIHPPEVLDVFCKADRHQACNECPCFLMHIKTTGGNCVGWAGRPGEAEKRPSCWGRGLLPGGFFWTAAGHVAQAVRRGGPDDDGAVLLTVAVGADHDHNPSSKVRWWGRVVWRRSQPLPPWPLRGFAEHAEEDTGP